MQGAIWQRIRTIVGRAEPPASSEVIKLDFPAFLRREDPAAFDLVWRATLEILEAVEEADLAPLSRRSPMLRDFDWAGYLRLSAIRVLRIAHHARKLVPAGSRVLDFGAYFGNFALALQRLGYRVDAVDAYSAYRGALAGAERRLQLAGVTLLDFESTGYQLDSVPEGEYDMVICAGVIEHIAHTPRPMLEAIDRVLARGGILMLETPNLGYLYTRERLGRGDSIFPDIRAQYETEIPFEGHHREYTLGEVEWMIARNGYEQVALETFNYSLYGQIEIRGAEVERYRRMAEDPSLREIILAVCRKPQGVRERGAKAL